MIPRTTDETPAPTPAGAFAPMPKVSPAVTGTATAAPLLAGPRPTTAAAPRADLPTAATGPAPEPRSTPRSPPDLLDRAPERVASDAGTAVIEFVGVTLLLLLPLLYLLLSVFSVQRAAFAVTQAAREAGRAYSTAPTSAAGAQRAQYAARLAMSDQGVADRTSVRFAPEGTRCGSSSADGAASLRPGARFTVCVTSRAPLPAGGASIPVRGQFTVAVDAFRRPR